MGVHKTGTVGKDVFLAASAAEDFDGQFNHDIVSYANSTTALRVNLANAAKSTGIAKGDTYASVEAFVLSNYNDIFIGSAAKDVVNGGAGNDKLNGNDGNDALTGHSGNDRVNGGNGNDSIWGGGGNDTLLGVAGNDRIWGDSGADSITGGADSGTFTLGTTPEYLYKYSGDLLIPVENLDATGEWVAVPERVALQNASNLAALPSLNGHAIFVITNGYDTAKNWNAVVTGGQVLDLGPGGKIAAHSSVVFDAGTGNVTVKFTGSPDKGFPGAKTYGTHSDGTITINHHQFGSVTAGDILTGGSGADLFVFNNGDGVDQINDFQKGIDHIDVLARWIDGNAANGEVTAYANGSDTLVTFSDGSADGAVDNMAILLKNFAAAGFDLSLFV